MNSQDNKIQRLNILISGISGNYDFEAHQKNLKQDRNFLIGESIVTLIGIGIVITLSILLSHVPKTGGIAVGLLWLIALMIISILVLDQLKLIKRLVRQKNYPYYQPYNEKLRELNHIIEMQDGKLFRRYHFINAEESDTKRIVTEIPYSAYEHKEDGNISVNVSKQAEDKANAREQACIFERLSEVELANKVTPILEYHRKQKENQAINEKEAYINKQSKLNADITEKDMKQLPLFQSLEKITAQVQKDIEAEQNRQQANAEALHNIVKR